MADIIQIRRGTAALWTSTNPVLADGELGFEKDTKKGKLGDGVTAWTALPYSFTGEIQETVANQITAAAIKATPVDGDHVGITDSAASNVLKKLSWANIKATLKTYFDTLYELKFSKGSLIQGSNVTLTGTLTGRLVGTGDITIAGTVTDIAATINAATSKTTPVDADHVGLVDSADTNTLKKLSWANIKATLKTYFDTLYELKFTKGSLIQGTNVTLTGTLTNRLVGTGDVTVAALGGGGTDLIALSNGYYTNMHTNNSSDAGLVNHTFYVPFTQALLWKNNMNITSVKFVLSSGVASSFLRFGLYELTSVNTLSLVSDYGQILTDGGGFQELVVTGTITKGKMYYLVVKRDDNQGGTVLISGGKTFSAPYTVHNGTGVNVTNSAALFKTGLATGAFPASDTLPTNGDHTISVPLVYMNLANI